MASGLDDNYVFPFLVMAFSASRNSKLPFHLKIAFAENLLSKANRQLISDVLTELKLSFEFIPIILSDKLKSQDHIQITSFNSVILRLQILSDPRNLRTCKETLVNATNNTCMQPNIFHVTQAADVVVMVKATEISQ